jgi:hypothetical protein
MTNSLAYELNELNDFERRDLFRSLVKYFGSAKDHSRKQEANEVADNILYDTQSEEVYSVSTNPLDRLLFEAYMNGYMDALDDVDEQSAEWDNKK